jgi:hypothetical protein
MKILLVKLKEKGLPKRDPKQVLEQFLKKNPNPEDAEIHKLAESLGIPPDEMEDIAYSMLSDMLSEDKQEPEQDMDPKELKKGEKTEKEHTKEPEVAKKIAKDHLTEDPKYYTKLKKAKL